MSGGVGNTTGWNGNVRYQADNGNDGGTSASAEGSFSAQVENAKGYGVSFGISGQVSVSEQTTTEDGTTTYTAETDASITLEAGVDTPRVGAEVARTEGIATTYEVSMPSGAATDEAIASANPFDPSTMPVDTVIRMDGRNYSGSEFNATFSNIALSSNVETYEGSSFVVEKTGETTVRVTTGPTSGLENYSGIGIDLGIASVEMGSTVTVDNSRYQTAEFDLSTPGGQAAYSHFLATGQMPADNGNGVSHMQTIETTQTAWTSTVEASLGSLSVGGELASSEGEYVTITYPDGSKTATATYTAEDGPTTTWEQHFAPDGSEIVDQRRYSYTFEIPDNADGEQLAGSINYSLTGDATQGPASAGDTVTLTFTEAQMKQYLERSTMRTEDEVKQGEYAFNEDVLESEEGSYAADHADSRIATPWEFANNLVDGGANMWEVAGTMGNLIGHASDASGQEQTLPATVTVNGEVVIEGTPEPDTGGGGSGGAPRYE